MVLRLIPASSMSFQKVTLSLTPHLMTSSECSIPVITLLTSKHCQPFLLLRTPSPVNSTYPVSSVLTISRKTTIAMLSFIYSYMFLLCETSFSTPTRPNFKKSAGLRNSSGDLQLLPGACGIHIYSSRKFHRMSFCKKSQSEVMVNLKLPNREIRLSCWDGW